MSPETARGKCVTDPIHRHPTNGLEAYLLLISLFIGTIIVRTPRSSLRDESVTSDWVAHVARCGSDSAAGISRDSKMFERESPDEGIGRTRLRRQSAFVAQATDYAFRRLYGAMQMPTFSTLRHTS